MRSKAYRGTDVNRVDVSRLAQGHEGQALVVGVDVGKYQLTAVLRWPDGTFERPWRCTGWRWRGSRSRRGSCSPARGGGRRRGKRVAPVAPTGRGPARSTRIPTT